MNDDEFFELLKFVNEEVSIYDLFDRSSATIRYDTRIERCQISCPFHGADRHASARVYPDSNSMYCFFCNETWDAVKFWAQINDMWTKNDKLDLVRSAKSLIREFGLRFEQKNYTDKIKNNLQSLNTKISGYNSLPLKSRQRLHVHYLSKVSRLTKSIERNSRAEAWPQIESVWNDLADIRLEDDRWKQSLDDWYNKALTKVGIHAKKSNPLSTHDD